MKQVDKIRVAVLYGGRSAEHEVSLQSAANVIQYLDQSRFEVVPIGINKEGHWFLGKDVFLQSLASNKVPSLHEKQSTWFTPTWVGTSVAPQEIKELVTHKENGKLKFDVVFPVLHGSFCEDGTLQGLLELANLPYVGCGVLASAIGMDKDVSKRLARDSGINVAPYVVVSHQHWQAFPENCQRHVEETLTYPVFVKPVNTGSSIGITKVHSADAFKKAIEFAFRFDNKVIVEKALEVIELEIAVLQSLSASGDPIVSVVGEVKPTHEFYSYNAKYVDADGAQLLIPANIPEGMGEKARTIAKKLFNILECEGMARVDLFLEKSSQEIFFNEINTLPGFTAISMYPKLLEASGISYTELLTHLIQLALNRHQIKSKLERSYSE